MKSRFGGRLVCDRRTAGATVALSWRRVSFPRDCDMGGFYLNAEQRLAVETIDKPVLVMAPVGTGKTCVLTERTARLLDSGMKPERILCLSFTNKAAREIRDRLTARFGKSALAITAKTFHALCAQIVRAESETMGLDSDFLIYDEEDC